MEITIYASDFTITDAMRQHIERKLRFTLTRIRSHIQSVSIRLEDINGPKGGLDKCCTLKILISNTPAVIIKDVQEDMYQAIDTALHRLNNVATRKIERLKARNRKAMKVVHIAGFTALEDNFDFRSERFLSA